MKILKWLWNKLVSKSPVKKDPIVVKPTKPIPEIPSKEDVDNFPPNPQSQIKKVAIIVGHGNGDSGAMGWNGMSEFNYNSFVAEEVQKANTGKEIKVFYRGPSGITGVALKAVQWNPDLVIELHLNAFNGQAHGCEVLVLNGDSNSGRIGKIFASQFTKKFNRTLRRDAGINWISSGDRGGSSLRALASIKYAILVEPFFIDNKDEWIEPMIYTNYLTEFIKAI